mgnify:CR=1 FL=1
MVKNGLITAQALADVLDISVETVWNYTLTDTIPFEKLEGQYHYNLKEVVTALTAIGERAGDYISCTRKFTYQDYLALPEVQGYRYEILAGELVKELGPMIVHQRVSRELEFMLLAYFRQVDPTGEVFDAPLDLTLGDFTVVQPDILYISGEQRDIIKEARIDGAPLLAVEIISESSRQKDRLRKRQIYQEAGIQHYWLVDPNEKTMECLALWDGEYVLAASGINDATLTHPSFPGLSIPLAGIWQGYRQPAP